VRVGDLVTLSASARNIGKIKWEQQKWFAMAGFYPNLNPHNKEEWNKWIAYWNGTDMVGLIVRIDQFSIIADYYVAWMANPSPGAQSLHIRSHLKFVSKGKR
jgi:hypothetical protein